MSENRAWLKSLKQSAPITLAMGASTLLLLGSAWFVLKLDQPGLKIPIPGQDSSQSATPAPATVIQPSSNLIAQLALVPAAERSPFLAQQIESGVEQDQLQARFMLAADYLKANDGKSALPLLKDLEQKYTLLASEIFVLRAQAYRQMGDAEKATQTWQALLKKFPKDPAVVEALYALGQSDSTYWNQAIKSFPAHPLTVAIAVQKLKSEPKRKDLLLLLAKHGLHLPDLKTYLKRLTDSHGKSLTPEEWHTVGFAYWEKLTYKESGQAYARAPQSALNRYRAARGLQIGDKKSEAIAAYKAMVAAYSNAPETPLALMKLGQIVDPPEQRLPYLDRAIQVAQTQKRSHLVAEALLAKAKLLKTLKKTTEQGKVEALLLKDYRSTNAAAELLWDRAQAFAKGNNLAAARENGNALAKSAPQSSLAPVALFWSGKWSQQLGEVAQQQQAFQTLWKNYPDSYYTWRSASLAGWPVGDFSTVRNLKPKPHWPQRQLPLAAGSETLKELYRLGQFNQAWKRWLWEFNDREQPSFAQQQTDGLIRIGVGEYLDGIFMLNNLDDRLADEPEHQAVYQQWRSHPGFWYALYPLDYYPETAGWAQQVNLNPLLALGLMRQESRFQPQIRSSVGAVGLMQVMPETGKWISDQIDVESYNLDLPSDNIRFGTWYLDYTHQSYEDDSALAIASYNAGPGNVSQWVKERKTDDIDEFIAEIPFDETRKYVTAVLENHWNYLRLYDPRFAELLRQNSS